MGFATEMTDQQLIDIVKSFDMVVAPMDRRFEGDDDVINALMTSMGIPKTVVDKHMIVGEVLREVAHRGIRIPRSNS